MTDLQLSVLLNKYQKFLEAALEKVKADLPEELKIEASNLFGQKYTRCPILTDLYDLDSALENDVDVLRGFIKKGVT